MFEQKLSEIIWRNHVHRSGDICTEYTEIFSLLKRVFSLQSEPGYTYKMPLFKTWTPPSKQVADQHKITIVQDSDVESDGELHSDASPLNTAGSSELVESAVSLPRSYRVIRLRTTYLGHFYTKRR